jgi:hypothetical protein
MKNNAQNRKWLVDSGLFIGLVTAALLDLTGLAIHQWLGLGVGLLAGYHMLDHLGWVESITRRWFGGASRKAKQYYLLDGALLAGFTMILTTGLAMSTWFDLSLSSYDTWWDVHVTVTIITLALVVVKVGLHWRWVVSVGRRMVGSPASPAAVKAPVGGSGRAPVKPAVLRAPVDTGRRDFLRLMGVVGAAAVVAAYSALDGQEQAAAQPAQTSTATLAQDSTQSAATSTTSVEQGTAQPAASSTTQATATSTPAPTQTSTSQAAASSSLQSGTTVEESSSCVVQCNRRCSYPGHCRRYRDSNGNGRCDLGECA